jgi:hypothetical protein
VIRNFQEIFLISGVSSSFSKRLFNEVCYEIATASGLAICEDSPVRKISEEGEFSNFESSAIVVGLGHWLKYVASDSGCPLRFKKSRGRA